MNRHPLPAGRLSRLHWALSVSSLCLAGCSGIEVDSDGRAAATLAPHRTYAWSKDLPPIDPSGATVTDDLIARMIEREVDANLAGLGMRQVPKDDADLLVAQQLTVAIRQEVKDPYYSITQVERYEEGTLRLEFVDKKTKRPVWSGSGRCRLRTVSRDVGLNHQDFVYTTEKRAWPVEALVDAILAR